MYQQVWYSLHDGRLAETYNRKKQEILVEYDDVKLEYKIWEPFSVRTHTILKPKQMSYQFL